MQGSEEAPRDAGHVLLCELEVVSGGGFRAWHQQGHEAGRRHKRTELHGNGAQGGGSRAVQGGLPPLGTEGDFP